MGKNLFTKAVALLLCFALAGCATDQQRTKTQGTVIGAVGGAVLLGGLGALAGVLSGNRDNVARYAIAGAAAGAALGGVAGYRWGERVAFKKERYTNSEDRLAANIQQASKVRVAAAQENNILRGQIGELHNRLQQLSAEAAAGNHDNGFRMTLVNFIDQRRQDVSRKIEAAGNEIADRTQALREDSNGNPQRVAELRGQIGSLSAERAQMQQANRELSSIRSRIGV